MAGVARSLLTSPVEFLVGGRPVVSATPDSAAATNAAFQAAPASTRTGAPPANDLFAGLVNQNTRRDSSAASPPPQNNADSAPEVAARALYRRSNGNATTVHS